MRLHFIDVNTVASIDKRHKNRKKLLVYTSKNACKPTGFKEKKDKKRTCLKTTQTVTSDPAYFYTQFIQ